MALSLNITVAAGAVVGAPIAGAVAGGNVSGVVSGTDAKGQAWEVRYEGFATPFEVWSAVNADGFCLAPGAAYNYSGETPVIRA